MKLYRTGEGIFMVHEGSSCRIPEDWDELIARNDLHGYLVSLAAGSHPADFTGAHLLAPIGTQEVWAAGVTYYRSRDARMAESKDAGGGDCYDRVYRAARPELFFKGTASRAAAPGAPVRIRSDAKWSVPEPELTLVINPRGSIIGYTIGNDMSSRDIEGENPLYLPQAKVYDGSCALGPCILVSSDPLPAATAIRLEIERAGQRAFAGATTLAELKREPAQLIEYLFRDNIFPTGAYLMTGTGIVPPDTFSLERGDRIRITIDAIGTLENTVTQSDR
ncbi:MAG TPA: fumarylacetoacetate hydrolase family protein [Steroidobacteraceae bacterium]|nr:fumarylacetoacetate hydrolase family protein [Steroidobacteraceae bacterium]